ncbi:MAG: dipeptide ABC transporter ATP-binding protein [Propionibacteriaceae bacterium]|jgi:peptide/nickel transport system ATP-binding protein|nr:dipeptide ABC transporter ATP-binding protein [Propionibacteriaceae bacterium]
MTDRLLQIEDLCVSFDVEGETVVGVRGVSFEVAAHEVVAVVGESGSGKTVTAMSVLGLLPHNASLSGVVRLLGQEVGRLDPAQLRQLRRSRVGMIFQDPVAALNPVFSIGFQLSQVVRLHQPDLSSAQVRRRVVELLELVEIDQPESRLKNYPHEFSGGQCQRVVIAMAIAGWSQPGADGSDAAESTPQPRLLIADEPTTALDVTVQAEILSVLRRIKDQLGASVLLITHNMGVVADLADRVVVMRSGQVVEVNQCAELFAHPQADYTKALLAAVPKIGANDRPAPDQPVILSPTQPVIPRAVAGSIPAPSPTPDPTQLVIPSPDQPVILRAVAGSIDAPAPTAVLPPTQPTVLEVSDLVVSYGRGRRGRSEAVAGVSLSVRAGEIVGLVGESGSGKTTLGRAAVGLAPVSGGRVLIEGQDLAGLSRSRRQALRRRIGVVFQNPATSLNPRYSVGATVIEPLRVLGGLDQSAARTRALELLEAVGLGPDWLERYPHELSGGQRQRVAIARAVALDPVLLIADEPTSALDVSVQAQVLDVFRSLQARLGFACLFISHDLAVVDSLCDRVAVMHQGRLVEVGPRREVLGRPQDPYTRRLVESAPIPDPVLQRARRQTAPPG